MTPHEHARTRTPRDALEELQHELTALGWDTIVSGEGPYPCLRVMDGYLAIEFVFAARFDEPHFTWSCTNRSHPLDDPSGAATRIAGDLRSRP